MKITKKTAGLLSENILQHQHYNVGQISNIDEKNALITLQDGSVVEDSNIWFLQNAEGKEIAMIPQQVLSKLLERLKNTQEELVFMALEREVAFALPIDFEDVMSVAKMIVESYRQKDGTLPLLNVAKIVQDVKNRHPNLFVPQSIFDGSKLQAEITKLRQKK